jgi:translocation and assembly module TamA
MKGGWVILALAVAQMLPGYALAEDISYDVKFEGADDPVIADLKSASQLVALEDKAPANETALRRRADADLARLKQVLNAEGYYDSGITMDVAPGVKTGAFVVTLTVQPGTRYTLAEVKIVQPNGAPPPEFDRFLPSAFGLSIGQPANSAPIVGAESKIIHAYAVRGWPFAKIVKREVVVDSADKTMHVTYTLDVGAPARFGATEIEGLTSLDPLYVQRRLKWQQDMPYDQGLIDDAKQTLVTSGLFASVSIEPAGAPGPGGLLPIEVKLKERLLHSIGAGGSYDTALGIQANVTWEDRDMFDNAEDLLVTAKGGQSDSGITAKFTRPDAFFYQQDFVTTATFENELEDAFRALHQEIQLGFQLHLSATETAGYSIDAEHARIDEKVDYRVYTMLGLPLFLRRDETDDLLNPTRGYRAGVELTPNLGLDHAGSYVQTKLSGSVYRKIDDRGDNILAAQLIVGASCCASLDSIPKDHRLYAGGGGTIRGFAYQKAGPFDQYFNSTGGRSLLVGSFEWRRKLTDSIQLVPFLDAGSDYQTVVPDFAAKQYLGAGIGVRYFTPIGPVRFDIATPINPHSKGDSPVQAYVSLGQAF